MFKKLLRVKKAQSTAEYALLIALVVAAVIAMQTYAQRAIQGRIRDASQYLTGQTSALGATNQYEPYYLRSGYDIDRDESVVQIQGNQQFDVAENSTRTRLTGGSQNQMYDGIGGLTANTL